MNKTGKWPGINDGKHTLNRVGKDTVIRSEPVPAHTLRPGDEVHENHDGKQYTYRVESVRPTRRGTSVIVNGYCVYSRNAPVRIVRKRWTREQAAAVAGLAAVIGARNA